jgi:hypothetical protein
MTKSDKSLVVLALAPNGVFVIGLLGWMAWRVLAGQSVWPTGAAPFVMALCIAFPMGSAALANVLRLRGHSG